MKKIHITLALLFLAFISTNAVTAQMKIKDGTISSTTSPDPNAVLELESNNKGLLMPRVALTATTSASPLAAHVAGMSLYNTATTADVIPGYYYDDGTKWIAVSGAVTANAWNLTGNAGTTPGTNFMGTTDDEDVVFKRNNIQAGLLQEGNTSWGVSALNPLTTGYNNEAIGYQSLMVNTTGGENAAIGNYALGNNTTGSYNVADGGDALSANTTGYENTAMGVNALSYNTTGYENVAIGDNALESNTTGSENTAIGTAASVGINLTNGTAIGDQATVNTSNTMEFGNSSVVGWGFGNVTPTSTNVFVVGYNSTNGNGAYLTAGGVWTNASDKNLKENISMLDGKNVLSRIKQLPVSQWKYKGTSEYHIGPMAQDFYNEFNLGTDKTHISTIDPAGVALIGIQELSIEVDSLKSINAQQQQANSDLQQQLNDLKTTINQMQAAMSQCCNNFSSSMQSVTLDRPAAIGSDLPRLDQNVPNPYNNTTLIGYYLPASTGSAQLLIANVTGQVLKTLTLSGTGNGQVTLNAGSLASGSYFYSLIINGQKVDTKEMILSK